MYSLTRDKRLVAMDQISRLPEFIIHQILSFLSAKEAAQTSVLSKTWLHAWATHPILVFDQKYFCKELAFTAEENIPEAAIQKFVKFVDCSLLRYCEHRLRIQKFGLYLTICDCNLVPFVNKWIGIALEKQVEELDLHVPTLMGQWYTVPQTVFTAKSIRVLKLQWCKLEQSFLSNGTMLCSLQELYLHRVYVDEQTIQGILSGCPFIENLTIKHCFGLGSDLVNLKLVDCDIKKVDISSTRLKNFVLCRCSKLVEAKIDARNLLSLCYEGDVMPSLYSTNPSGQWKAHLKLNHNDNLDTWRFVDLREFLTKSNQFKVLRLEILSEMVRFNMEDLEKILVPPIYRVNVLELDLRSSLSSCSALVDGLLWSCHPRTLFVRWGSKSGNEFIIFLFGILIDTEDPSCCGFGRIKCWRHYLKDFKIETSEGNEDEKTLRWRTLSEASTLAEGQKIRFKFTWQSHLRGAWECSNY